jgi:2-oxoglutarate ferredoxin oxidoreductase subunit alpha
MRLMNKTMSRTAEIVETESLFLDDAEIVFFSFGISARSAAAAVRLLRNGGIKAGLLRARTLWPFPEKAIASLSNSVKAIVVPELNTGMAAGIVKSFTHIPVHSVAQVNGAPISPAQLVKVVEGLR